MIRQLLIITLAGLATASATAFPVRKSIPATDFAEVFAGKVVKGDNPQGRMATRGDESATSLDYTLASEPYTAFRLRGTNVGDTIYQAFEMPKKITSQFAGDSITSVNITTGVYILNGQYRNLVKEVTVFVASDIENLRENIIYSQKGGLGMNGFTEYKVDLDTPVKVTGENGLFVGYYFTDPNSGQYYLSVDGEATEDVYGCYVGTQNSEGKIVWKSYSTDYGNLCLGCTITGSNMPPDGVRIMDYSGPSFSAPATPFEYLFLLKGTGPGVTDVEITTKVGNAAPVAKTITLENTLGYNKETVVSLDVECSEVAMGIPLEFEVTKVNGKAVEGDGPKGSGVLNCFDPALGYPRLHLLEEGTGTWCGYCPRGIVMMEYVADEYPEEIACAAIHVSGSTRDPMEVKSATAVASKYFLSFPSAMIDRTEYLSEMTPEEIDLYMAANKNVPAVVKISGLSGEINDAGRLIVGMDMEFPLDFQNNDRYRVAYYLVENGMGPYDQTNYYSGGYLGNLNGWEREPESVSTIFNDVVRYLAGGVTGFSGTLPAEIKAGETYSDASSLPMSAIKSDKCTLIGFVVDNLTEEIANAAQIIVENPSGINDIEANSSVIGVRYHDLNGLEVKDPVSGLYIVRRIHADGKVTVSKEMFR